MKKIKKFCNNNGELMLLSLPAVLLLFVFCYIPMFGIIIAFQDYSASRGILRSKFIGLKNFEYLFKSQDAFRITRNTLLLNLSFLVIGTILALFIALLMFEIRNRRKLLKTYNTALILPNFISWVIVGSIAYILLESKMGIINQFIRLFGGNGVDWYKEPRYWPAILTIFSAWKTVGLNSIIYYASLMGIDGEYFEAAELDGASKLKMVFHITLPFLIPTIIILTILSIGNIFRADFGLFYNLTRDVGQLYSTTDVIDTYIFRVMRIDGNIGVSAATCLYQSFVGLILVLATNMIVKKIEPSHSMF